MTKIHEKKQLGERKEVHGMTAFHKVLLQTFSNCCTACIEISYLKTVRNVNIMQHEINETMRKN